MKAKFVAAIKNKAMVKITTELGRNNVTISVSDAKLNWNDIELDAEDSKRFKEFMRSNDM